MINLTFPDSICRSLIPSPYRHLLDAEVTIGLSRSRTAVPFLEKVDELYGNQQGDTICMRLNKVSRKEMAGWFTTTKEGPLSSTTAR